MKFLSNMVSKLVEISPSNYKVVAAVSALDPNYIISSEFNTEKKKKIKTLVKILSERDWIKSVEVDNAKPFFCSLSSCTGVKLNEKFENSGENDGHLDYFSYGLIYQDKFFKDLWFPP